MTNTYKKGTFASELNLQGLDSNHTGMNIENVRKQSKGFGTCMHLLKGFRWGSCRIRNVVHCVTMDCQNDRCK